MSLLAALTALLAAAAAPAGTGPPDGPPLAPTQPATTQPATDVAGSGPAFAITVPGGYRALVDDTGVLAVVVPDAWDDVDTGPVILDGRLTPSILAATARDDFVTGWDGSGASLIVTPFATANENIGRFTITGGCADGFITTSYRAPAEAVLEGVDEGLVTTATGCGPEAAATWTIAAVNDAAQTFSLVLVIQTATATAADQEAVAFVLDHFGATPWATSTASEPASSSPLTSLPIASSPTDSTVPPDSGA